nr:NADH dehydrogenase subunit 3 [Meteorus sp. 2 XHS-2023a]
MIILILMFFFIMLMISLLLMFLNLLICKKIFLTRSKGSPFECGFEMLESIRLPFSINFYLIAVLFLIFDIEIVYLFTMILSNNFIIYKLWFFCSMMVLMILFLGLEYEKKEGSLKWFI